MTKVTGVHDDMPPHLSPNTRLVAAARAVSFNFGCETPFMDEFDTEAPEKHEVTWVMDGDQRVEFIWAERGDDGKLVAREEEITFSEFRSRYISLDWCRENPDHPISYMRASNKMHVEMIGWLKNAPRHERIRHGRRTARISTAESPERRAKLLKMLGGR